MVLDWLIVWGVTQAAGALVRPVLEDFAKDVVRDSAKDYVKGCFGSVFKALKKDEHEKALGKALKELVQLIDDQLRDAGVPAQETVAWAADVKVFVRSEDAQAALRQAFESSTSSVDRALLERGWPTGVTARLPDDFDWEIVAKTFSKRLKLLRAQDEDLRQIYAAQAVAETAETTRQILGIVPGFDLGAYRRALLQQYQKLQLQSLDPYSDRIAKLHSVFVEQNVRECQEYAPQLLTLPKEVRRRFLEQSGAAPRDLADLELREEIAEERLRAFHSQTSRGVFEVTGDPRKERLVILGDPGSGKSSLLRYLALQWAEERANAVLLNAPLVLLIELRDYAHWPCHGAKSFLLYLHEGPTFHRINQLALQEYLKSAANVVLLLDGLDEIFDEDHRKWALNDLQRFADEYANVRLILTSRVIGYEKSQQRLTEMGFGHFMLQDLEDEQVETFLERWHQETFTDDRDRRRKLTQLEEAIGRTRAIRELAGNPLLLTLMAILNRQQELPRDRARLYERSAQLLMLDWKTELLEERFPQLKEVGIGFDEKAAMLRAVALHMQTTGLGERGNIIARQDLERILLEYLAGTLLVEHPHGLADALVEQLRGQNFILCDLGNNHYAFVHRTFLEYFCAEAFVQQFEANLDLVYLRDKVFSVHWNDEDWHETLCLVAGVIGKKSTDHVKQLIDFLLTQNDPAFEFNHLFLAARCCQELRNPRTLGTVFDDARKALESLLSFDFPYSYEFGSDVERSNRLLAKTVAVLVSAQLLDDPTNWLRYRAANDTKYAVRRAAVRELARGWKDDPDTLPWLKERVNDDDWNVREVALQELARGWKDDPDTLSLLKERGTKDFTGNVESAALLELARGWKNDPDILPWIKEHATSDTNEWARRAAVQALQGWRGDPEALVILKDRAVGDAFYQVRRAATQELARGWKDDPDTLPLLKDRAANDDDNEARQAALQELARGWKDDPDTLRLLKDWSANDGNYAVRRAALEELAHGWKHDPDTLPLLKDRAANDDNYAVRHAAVEELARGWKDDPDTLPWLKDRAANDDNYAVRRAALRELARGWKDDPDTLPLLKDRVANDEVDVRGAALQELARGWKDDPDTLPLLKDRVANDDDSAVRQTAVQELARRWRDDPDTLTLLKVRAANDTNAWVRQAAVQELVRGWKDDPDTLPLLKRRAAKDDHSAVRQTVLEELARGWKDDPDTLPLLKDRAANDEDIDVRSAILQELAHGWKADPDTLTLLKDRAANDDDQDVRQAAVRELARGWKHDPDTLTLLKDRAANDDDQDVRQAAVLELARRWKDDPDTMAWLKDQRAKDDT